jgi:8-oxo-dGTP diphosphatase
MDRSSKIELTNMCLIYDDKRVLVQEKQGLKEKYKGGLVFPGGHVEPDESLLDSVIREMKEETPKLLQTLFKLKRKLRKYVHTFNTV